MICTECNIDYDPDIYDSHNCSEKIELERLKKENEALLSIIADIKRFAATGSSKFSEELGLFVSNRLKDGSL